MDTDQRVPAELTHEQNLLFILVILTAVPRWPTLAFPTHSVSLHTARHSPCYYDFCTTGTFLWFSFPSYQ